MLQMSDLVVLNSMREDLPLDWKAQRVPKEGQERILAAGITDEKGALTEYGKDFVMKLKSKILLLKGGIPFKHRVKNEAMAAMLPSSSWIGWFQAKFKDKTYITNGALFLLGQPSKEMEAVEASAEQRKGIATAIHTGTAGKKDEYTKLVPTVYQVEEFGGIELVWLVSQDGSMGVAIQAMFFDLIKERYPTASFWVHTKKAQEKDLLHSPVQARVTNRGLKNNVVGLVMAWNTSLPLPKLEEAHGEVPS